MILCGTLPCDAPKRKKHDDAQHEMFAMLEEIEGTAIREAAE